MSFEVSIWTWIGLAIIYLLFPYLVFKIAKKKKRNATLWTVISVITNPIIILIIINIVGTNSKKK